MKGFILMIVWAMIGGCAPTIYRTGTISVNKFTYDAETNRNPIQISNEAVENIRSALESAILRNIKEETKLKIVKGGCANADYELTGKITRLDGEIDHHYRFVMITQNNKYTIDTEGLLIDCKKGIAIVDFSHDKDKENIMDAIEDVVGNIVNDIR